MITWLVLAVLIWSEIIHEQQQQKIKQYLSELKISQVM